MNCVAHSTFEVITSDSWIVSAKIHQRQRRNKRHTVKASQYNWFLLANYNFGSPCKVTVKNKLDILQEIYERNTPNDEYENFVNTQIKATAECIKKKQDPNIEIHRRK